MTIEPSTKFVPLIVIDCPAEPEAKEFGDSEVIVGIALITVTDVLPLFEGSWADTALIVLLPALIPKGGENKPVDIEAGQTTTRKLILSIPAAMAPGTRPSYSLQNGLPIHDTRQYSSPIH